MFLGGGALDAYAELSGLLIAGARIEIIRRAPVEFVAESKFTANVHTDGCYGHTNREPADDLERFAIVLLVEKSDGGGVGGHGRLGLLGP